MNRALVLCYMCDTDNGEEDGYETDIRPSLKDVHGDFDKLRKEAGIKGFRCKAVKRNYAFGEQDVPVGEHQWMKVVYPFSGTYSSRRRFVSWITLLFRATAV